MKNLVNIQYSKKFFEIEKYRSIFEKEKKYSELIKLYNINIFLPNMNTGKKWDSMNFYSEINENNNPMANDRTKIISKLLNFNNKNTLNIGFGPSNVEKLVLTKNFNGNWTGIDISKESVKYAKKLFPKFRFVLGSILKVNLPKNEYDIVIASEVLEHISHKDTFKILNKIYNSLTQNGYFIVSVPLNEKLQDMVLHGTNPNAHLRAYTKELIEAELNISKFKTIKTEKLSAFHNNYKVKKYISRLFPKFFTKNNIIILAQKI